MLSSNADVGSHIDARFRNVFADIRNVYNNNFTILTMALCLKYSVLTVYHPANIVFQTTLKNSHVLLVANIFHPLAIF
jgi:hypothetical protein